jgi:hypothetical protein
MLVGCWAGAASAFELTQVERKIAHEPTYESGSATYGLLVFGPDGGKQVCLALDGDKLHMDRNANRDLTDDGPPIAAAVSQWTELGDVEASDGTYGRLRMYRGADGQLRFRVGTPNRGGQYVGFAKAIRPTFADELKDAPIIHFGGAMTLGQYGPTQTIPRNIEGVSYRVTSLKLMLGTPGIGDGTFAAYHCNCRRKKGNDGTLVGNFSYATAAESAEQIERRVTYQQRG